MADILGSTRLVLDSAGTPAGYHDYLPFGEEILGGAGNLGGRGSLYGAADGVTHKFTGKERDAELAGSAMQGFDYFGARYLPGRREGLPARISRLQIKPHLTLRVGTCIAIPVTTRCDMLTRLADAL